MASSICLSSSYLSRDSRRGCTITSSIWGNNWNTQGTNNITTWYHGQFSHLVWSEPEFDFTHFPLYVSHCPFSLTNSPSSRSQTWGSGQTWWSRSEQWAWSLFLCPWKERLVNLRSSLDHSVWERTQFWWKKCTVKIKMLELVLFFFYVFESLLCLPRLYLFDQKIQYEQ